MNTKHLAIAGPYTHENLSIFLLLGADAFDGQRFIPLDDALEQKCVTEATGDVAQFFRFTLEEIRQWVEDRRAGEKVSKYPEVQPTGARAKNCIA